MKHLFLILAAFVVTNSAHAGPWNRFFQDAKFPTQAMLEHKAWTNPKLGSAQTVLSAGSVGLTATTFSTFAAQPDFARNLVLTPTGTTANVAPGTAVVTGKNLFGATITENFAIASEQSTATTGSKAFASVSSILFPAAVGSGVTLNVVAGDKLGLHRCADDAGKYVFSEFNGAFETSRGTMAFDATHVESNTFVPNGTMDASKNVEIFFVENFRCYPIGY